jgi:hypothetical protein
MVKKTTNLKIKETENTIEKENKMLLTTFSYSVDSPILFLLLVEKCFVNVALLAYENGR